MYEHTLYDSIFAFGFFGKAFFALAVFAVSLGMSLLVGSVIDPLTSARSKSEA